jgi:hypothetical protein
MRRDDEEFAELLMASEFLEYYENLDVAEIADEVLRLEDPVNGRTLRVMNQYGTLYKRCVDIACFAEDISDDHRSALISACNDMRDVLEKTILPRVKPEFSDNLLRAIAGQLEYIKVWSAYPRAAELIITGARHPSGPYSRGIIGDILSEKP